MTFQSHPFPYVMTFVTCLVIIFVSTDKELFSSDDNIWPSLIPRVMVNTSRSRVGSRSYLHTMGTRACRPPRGATRSWPATAGSLPCLWHYRQTKKNDEKEFITLYKAHSVWFGLCWMQQDFYSDPAPRQQVLQWREIQVVWPWVPSVPVTFPINRDLSPRRLKAHKMGHYPMMGVHHGIPKLGPPGTAVCIDFRALPRIISLTNGISGSAAPIGT